MGWKGSTFTPGKIFGDVVDTILRQAGCNVVFVKLGDRSHAHIPTANSRDFHSGEIPQPTLHNGRLRIDRWLVPLAGGPNAQQGVQLLPGLLSLSGAPEVTLCQVFHPSDDRHDTTTLDEQTKFLSRKLSYRHGDCVVSCSVCAKTIPEALLSLAQAYKSDAIILGASREGIFQQALKGNIPAAIALHSNCTVVIVRGALSD
jgi:CIC family chloride channel protein